jgi:6-phosphogluconolactonase
LVDLGVDAYERVLLELGSIDLVHLGLGPDGHTASLFAGSDALDETGRFVVRTRSHLPPMHDRLTLTLPALALARHVVFTVEGEGKRDAWWRVRAGDDVPAARVVAGCVTWLVERDLGDEDE